MNSFAFGHLAGAACYAVLTWLQWWNFRYYSRKRFENQNPNRHAYHLEQIKKADRRDFRRSTTFLFLLPLMAMISLWDAWRFVRAVW